MRLLVITVNYCTAPHIVRALDVLPSQLNELGEAEWWIVDNCSPDNSIEVLREAIATRRLEERVRLIESPVNGGFGAGNNVAFRAALKRKNRPEYFYLLNPDAIPDPGAVAALIEFIERHPTVGAAGGALRDEQGRLQTSAFRFPNLLSEIESSLAIGVVTRLLEDHRVSMELPPSPARVDWISGASMMIRREAIERAGMFDEEFFLYYEEVELCRRFYDAGYEVFCVPDAVVCHVSGVTTGVSGPAARARRVPRYWFESRARYLRKRHGALGLAAFNVAAAVCVGLYRVREYAGRREPPYRPYFLRDLIRYSLVPATTTGPTEPKSPVHE